MNAHDLPIRPWYREPMLWLVLGLPAAVVVAGFLTLAIALRSGGADVASDPVQRIGKAQTLDLTADRVAARRGMRARLALSADTEAIELTPDGAGFDGDRLSLRLSHPTAASGDLSLDLLRVDDERFVGRLALPRDHAWNLQLTPAEGDWRLQGRLRRNALGADLVPAVDDG